MEDTTSSRKRPRPVVSCLRCRDKKLKCDRTTPCENCVKSQVAKSCMYSRSGQHPSQEHTVTLRGLANPTLEDLAVRMAKVEELLGVARTDAKEQSPSMRQPLIGTVVVKGDRSVYYGQNDRNMLLNQFVDIKNFMSSMVKDNQLQATSKHIKLLQDKAPGKIASPDSIQEPDYSVALLELRKSMPPKTYCDRLIDIYIQQFERTMRVLHFPSFKRQYDQIWANTNPELCTSSFIIPQVTAVMTMAYHMDDASQINQDQTHRAYLKRAAIDLVQAWLDELGRKQRTELPTLQVEILVLLSKSLRGSLTPERLWSSTGALIRSGMVMGLHTDPTSVPNMSPFHTEMRRRIWATMLEMDVQASMFAGMPLVGPELDPASLAPSNIDDMDFNESSASLPPSKPLNTYTDNLYQVILASSLPQRLKALSLVQRSAPNVEEAIDLGRKLEEYIIKRSEIMSLTNNNSNVPQDGGSLLHRILLDLYLRRPLLCLYKPLLLDPHIDPTMHTEIRRHCLLSSQAILSYQDLYTIPALAAITESPWAHQNFFYRCCKTDVLWAALTLCQHIKLLHSTTGHSDVALIQTVENTVACLIERVGQKGSDLKDILFLALALRSVQLPEHMLGRELALQQAVRKTMAACRERLMEPVFGDDEDRTQRSHTQAQLGKRSKTSTVEVTPMTSTATSETMGNSLPAMDFLPEVGFDETADFSDMAGLTGVYDTGDAFDFGMQQDWNWDYMWQ